MIVIGINFKGEATIAAVVQGQWKTENPTLLKTLKLLHIPEGYHPNRDLALAKVAIKQLGGKILTHTESPKGTGNVDEGPDE